MRRRFPRVLTALCTAILLGPAVPLGAQVSESAIVGTCLDPSGASVPQAAVMARHTGTNAKFEATTNISGNYVFPSLPIGEYEVSVTAPGFKTAVKPGIRLRVGDRLRVDFTLELGVTEERVQVTGEAPLVQADSSGLGQVIENKRITDLPLNSRNALALALLTPGVRNLQGGINIGFGRSQNYQVANIGVNGSPGGLNLFLLDGGLNTNFERGEVGVAPLVESIAEFKVLTNFLPPEFGLTGGGVVNTVSKSGANQLHGSIYEFLRNDKLDARNTFADVRAPFRYNQFGAAVGGPVWIPKVYRGKDRTFFFFNYEGSRFRSTANPLATVPTEAMRRGDFSELRDASGRLIPLFDPATTTANPNGPGFVRQPFAGNRILSQRIDRVAAKVVELIPLPNRPPNNAFTQSLNFISSQPRQVDVNQFHTRIDHSFGASNRLFGRWSRNQESANRPDDSPPWPIDIWGGRNDRNLYQQFLLSDTQTFSPTLINETRLTALRQAFPFTPASFNQGWPQKIGLPPLVPSTLFPIFNISGLDAMGGTNTLGLRFVTSYQLFEMVTKVRSNHTFKFGTEVRLLRESNFQVSAPSGSFNFTDSLTGNPQSPAGTGNGLASFLLGQVSSSTLQVFTSPTNVGHAYSFFIGDDWKATRRLTLNIGLRYDFQAPPVERRGQSSNFNPFVRNPDNPNLQGRFEFARVNYGDTVLRDDRNDFGPRLGFAYDVFGTAKTVVRGGYALLYAPRFSFGFFPSNAGFSVTNTYQPPGNNTNLPAFQLQDGPPFVERPQGAAVGASAFLGSAVNWEEANKRTPYTQQWNLSIQQQVPGNWVVEAGYAGNRGTKLLSSNYEYNDLDLQFLPLGLTLQDSVPNPVAGQVPGSLGSARATRRQTLLPFPQYTSVMILQPHNGSSTYHSFLLRAERRFAAGLTLLASYTNAKLISDSARNLIDFLGVQTGGGFQSYQAGKFNRRAERATDPTDVSQRLVISYVYELPIGRSRAVTPQNRLLQALLGGWSTSGLFTVQGGQPIAVRGANNFLANRPNSTGSSAKLSQRSRNRWFNTEAFVNPPNFTYGNVSRTLPDVRGPGLTNLDMALLKNNRIAERLNVQFRAEAFNLANLTNLRQPNATFVAGPGGNNASSTFGTISSAFDARSLQFGLKLIW